MGLVLRGQVSIGKVRKGEVRTGHVKKVHVRKDRSGWYMPSKVKTNMIQGQDRSSQVSTAL